MLGTPAGAGTGKPASGVMRPTGGLSPSPLDGPVYQQQWQPPPRRPRMPAGRKALIAVGVIAVLAVVGLVGRIVDPKGFQDPAPADSSPAVPETPSPSASRSDAQILADYDHDAYPVADYQRLLDRLGPYCSEPVHKVAGEVWASQQDLAKNGVTATNLEVLRHLEGAASVGPREDCGGLLAAYLVLREKG